MYRGAAILAALALTETHAIKLDALEAVEDVEVPTLTQADTEEEKGPPYDQKGCRVANPHGPQNAFCDAHKGYVESFLDRSTGLANQFINSAVGAVRSVAGHADKFTNCAARHGHPMTNSAGAWCHNDCCDHSFKY